MSISHALQFTVARVLRWVPVFLLGLLLATSAHAQVQKVAGVDSTGTARVIKTSPDGSIASGPGVVKTGAPSWTVSVSAVSAAATALTAGTCYRVACNAPVFFRTGTSTPTALTTDLPMYGPAVEKVCLPSTDTAVAFITASGTATCVGTLVQ